MCRSPRLLCTSDAALRTPAEREHAASPRANGADGCAAAHSAAHQGAITHGAELHCLPTRATPRCSALAECHRAVWRSRRQWLRAITLEYLLRWLGYARHRRLPSSRVRFSSREHFVEDLSSARANILTFWAVRVILLFSSYKLRASRAQSGITASPALTVTTGGYGTLTFARANSYYTFDNQACKHPGRSTNGARRQGSRLGSGMPPERLPWIIPRFCAVRVILHFSS